MSLINYSSLHFFNPYISCVVRKHFKYGSHHHFDRRTRIRFSETTDAKQDTGHRYVASIVVQDSVKRQMLNKSQVLGKATL